MVLGSFLLVGTPQSNKIIVDIEFVFKLSATVRTGGRLDLGRDSPILGV